ncbi:short transient receptor potential channel 6-like [Apostichopus japonicus]|uniref:short transient receptor potential channel 6-like n=1 Tax=Stichopus japonicus TaxID=307972 RepID=UPI003AB6F568
MGRKMGRKLPWRRRAFREDHKGHKKIDLDKVGSSSSDSDGENGRHGDTLDEVETSMMENTNIEAGDVNVSEEEDEEGADPFDGGSFHIGGLTIDDQPTVKTVKEAVVISDIERLSELLQDGSPIGDGLLIAVSLRCPQIIQTICNFIGTKDPSESHNIINGFASGHEFLASTTALQLAAKENDFDTIKILIRHGAMLPDLKSCLHVPGVKGDKLLECFSFLQYVKAIVSPSLIILTETNPVGRAFRLAVDLSRYSETGNLKRTLQSHPSFTKQIDEVIDTTEDLLCNLLDQCKSKREIEVFLAISATPKCFQNAKRRQPKIKKHHNGGSALPVGLEQAISLTFKKFVAHPFSQMAVTERIFHGPIAWDEMGPMRFLFLSLMVIMFTPFLCLSYSLCPVKKLVQFMETPYVRILNSFSSHLLFLLFLLLTAVNVSYTNTECPDIGVDYPEGFTCSEVNTLYWPIYGRMYIILVITAGQVMWTVASIYKMGAKSFFGKSWSWINLTQTCLYAASLAAYFVSLVQVDVYSSITDGGTEVVTVNRKPANHTVYFSVNGTLYQPSRAEWSTFETQIWAEVTFSVANILTVQRLLHICIYFESVGSLIISMGRMLSNVFKFAVVGALIVFSFALGFAQLMAPYSDLGSCEDDDFHVDHCGNAEMFESVQGSLHTLFWAIFGEFHIVDMSLPINLFMVHYTVQILHAIYIVVTSIILLNMLIAAMLTTYESIQGNLHTEWIFSRTKLLQGYCGHRSNVPVPFNLVPSVRVIWGIVKKISRRIASLLMRLGVTVPERFAARLNYHWKRKPAGGAAGNRDNNIRFKERQKILETLVERYKHGHLKVAPPPRVDPITPTSRRSSVNASISNEPIDLKDQQRINKLTPQSLGSASSTPTSSTTHLKSTGTLSSLEVIPEDERPAEVTPSNGNPGGRKHTSSVSLV